MSLPVMTSVPSRTVGASSFGTRPASRRLARLPLPRLRCLVLEGLALHRRPPRCACLSPQGLRSFALARYVPIVRRVPAYWAL